MWGQKNPHCIRRKKLHQNNLLIKLKYCFLGNPPELLNQILCYIQSRNMDFKEILQEILTEIEVKEYWKK